MTQNFMQMVHVAYIPLRPRNKEDKFNLIYAKITNQRPDIEFITDIETDCPLDASHYDEHVLASLREQVKETLETLFHHVCRMPDPRFQSIPFDQLVRCLPCSGTGKNPNDGLFCEQCEGRGRIAPVKAIPHKPQFPMETA